MRPPTRTPRTGKRTGGHRLRRGLLAAASLAGTLAFPSVAGLGAQAAAQGAGSATAVAASAPPSGRSVMTPALQAMQRDDAANPGMLWIAEGEALWRRPEGADARSCAQCHGEARASMRGVAPRYPAFDAARNAPIDLRGRIEDCRRTRQGAAPLPPESAEGLALEAYVGHQSRGMPIAAPEDPRLDAARERGAALYHRRIGQLDLACAHCHDERVGRRLGSSPIPPADPSGYPLYRLEWQTLGSLQRRLRNCMAGVRAEPSAFGAAELLELELYLMRRAGGVPLEVPAVRP